MLWDGRDGKWIGLCYEVIYDEWVGGVYDE